MGGGLTEKIPGLIFMLYESNFIFMLNGTNLVFMLLALMLFGTLSLKPTKEILRKFHAFLTKIQGKETCSMSAEPQSLPVLGQKQQLIRTHNYSQNV